ALESKGLLRRAESADERKDLLGEATTSIASRVDEILRDLAVRRLAEFRPELGRGLIGEAIDALLDRVEPAAVARKPTSAERAPWVESRRRTYGDRWAVRVLPDDVPPLITDAKKQPAARGVPRDRPALFPPPPSSLERAAAAAGDVLGFTKPTLFSRIAEQL